MEKRNKWGGHHEKRDPQAELLLDLLVGATAEEGYVVRGFEELGMKTSAYGGIEVTRGGKTFNISVDEV